MRDTKEYIVDQAYKLFLSHSYEAVSISDISKSVGLTKGAIYHHFLNKEELFMAVVDKYVQIDVEKSLVNHKSLLDYIDESIENAKKIISNTIGETTDFVPVNLLSLLIDALRHYPGYEKNKNRFFDSELKKAKIAVTQAIKRKEIRDDIDADITAMNMFSINLGLAVNLMARKSPNHAIDMVRKQLYEFYELLKI
ncbi:MAG: TetR/AcrR family transcriptional regulator [Bacteroidales bacterium]|nr:TetR/AcrR family transcriptional regulator [Bacteroidales bacterium]